MDRPLSPFLVSFLLGSSIFAIELADVQGQSYGSLTSTIPLLQDPQGNVLTDAMVGQLAVLSTTVANSHNDTSFVVIIELRDEDGVTAYLNWQNGTLPKNAEVDIGLTWIPAETGNYVIRTFMLSSLSNPEILSPVVQSEVAITTFPTEIIVTSDLDPLSPGMKEELIYHVANTYKKMAEPYTEVEYEWLKYQIRFDGSTFYNERESYMISSNATAKVRNVNSYETYTLRGVYNSVDKLVGVTISHDTHYLPEEAASVAIEIAKSTTAVKQFFERNGNNETSSPTIISSQASYLDSREVKSTKYSIDNSGNVTERPEFTFLPDSGQVIEFAFVALPRAAFESGEEIAGPGSPFIWVYLEPNSYEVLGTYEFP